MEGTNIYSLDNIDNYKYELMHSSPYIFKIYVNILNSYITEFNSIKLIFASNINLYYYLFDKGLATISHIFKILLKNTKNIDLVNYYCIKTINYYIEFILQNNKHADDKITYTHASLFSYGNTIYKLNKAYIKTSMNILDQTVSYIIHNNENQELSIFKNIELMIELYIKQIGAAIRNQTEHTQDIIEYSSNIMEKLIELYPYDDRLCEINFDLENLLSHRLKFAIDFISLTNISSINSLIRYIIEKNEISLNKDILLKNLLNKEKQNYNDEDYIKLLV